MTLLRAIAAPLLLATLLLPGAFVSPLVAQAQQPPAKPFDAAQGKPQDEFVSVDQLPPQEQLPAAPLLIAAYSVVWLAIGGYLIGLSRRLGAVKQEMERLEAEVKRGHRT